MAYLRAVTLLSIAFFVIQMEMSIVPITDKSSSPTKQDDKTPMSISPRIVNGQKAKPGDFPYQVFLQIYPGNNVTRCGASLISNEWVLTAAHCIEYASQIYLMLGAADLNNTDEGHVIRSNKSVIIHPKFDRSWLHNDIALIEMNQTVEFASNIEPIRLPKGFLSHFENVSSTASGWGKTRLNNTAYDHYLRSIDMWVMTHEECIKTFNNYSETVVCARGLNNESTCIGDSGGPLAWTDPSEDVRYLLGAVSIGEKKNCSDGHPIGFQRVTLFLDWIKNVTGIE